jgi:hypothetical protein
MKGFENNFRFLPKTQLLMRPLFLTILFTALCLEFIACKAQTTGKTSEPMDAPAQTEYLLAGLKTGGCRGFCPVYELRISSLGKATYQGLMNMARMGALEFTLSETELEQLRMSVAKANLWEYPASIPTQVMDAPHNTLSVERADGSAHSVTGSVGRPAQLIALENRIIELGEQHGLQLREGINPNELDQQSRREVQVLLADGVNAGNWIMQFTELKLQLVRRTGEENNWIVAYDPRQIREASFLKMLKDLDTVIDARANQ